MKQGGWKDFASFSRSERRGVTVLVFLCLASAVFQAVVPEFISRREIRRFERMYGAMLENPGDDDLSNMMTDTPWIGPQDRRTAEGEDEGAPQVKARAVSPPDDIDLNKVSAHTLIATGLAPADIAYRIVGFRESLGGFHRIGQLREVYGMTDPVYRLLVESTVIKDTAVQRLGINILEAEALEAHPYIHRGLARQMVNFREKVKPFASSDDLGRLYFMNDSLLRKIIPYIDFQIDFRDGDP